MSNFKIVQFSSVQSLSRSQLFATPWIKVHQASLSITNSQSLLKLMSIESVTPSSHLILCHPFSSCPNPSQHHGPFQWVNPSHEVAKVLEFLLQSFSLIFTPSGQIPLVLLCGKWFHLLMLETFQRLILWSRTSLQRRNFEVSVMFYLLGIYKVCPNFACGKITIYLSDSPVHIMQYSRSIKNVSFLKTRTSWLFRETPSQYLELCWLNQSV